MTTNTHTTVVVNTPVPSAQHPAPLQQYPGYQPVPVQPWSGAPAGYDGRPVPSAPMLEQPYGLGPPPPYQESGKWRDKICWREVAVKLPKSMVFIIIVVAATVVSQSCCTGSHSGVCPYSWRTYKPQPEGIRIRSGIVLLNIYLSDKEGSNSSTPRALKVKSSKMITICFPLQNVLLINWTLDIGCFAMFKHLTTSNLGWALFYHCENDCGFDLWQMCLYLFVSFILKLFHNFSVVW